MATQINNPSIDIAAGEALEAYRLVKSDGTYADADATKDYLGVTQQKVALGARVPVRLKSAGTCKVTAAAAITAGAVIYKANDGKVSTTSTGSVRVGIAIDAASGDGSIIEALLD